MAKRFCKDGKHEFEWIVKSCGCEYEVCYRCDHEVCVSAPDAMCEMICKREE